MTEKDKIIEDYLHTVRLYRILDNIAEDFECIQSRDDRREIKDGYELIDKLGDKFSILCNNEIKEVLPILKERLCLDDEQIKQIEENHKHFAINGINDRDEPDIDRYFRYIQWHMENLFERDEKDE